MSASETVRIWPGSLLVGLLLGLALESQAQVQQPRRTIGIQPTGRRPVAEAPGAEAPLTGDAVQVRQFIGVGRQTLMPTPEYRTSVSKSSTRPREWVQITVKFDTVPEWIDLLTVEYQVLALVKQGGQRQYSLYKQTVEYADVERGRDHQSAVLIAPSAVKRFGVPVAAHVTLLVGGVPVAKADDLEPDMKGQLPPDWWENRQVLDNPNVVVRQGYLRRMDATPFGFINTDDYEVAR